MAALIPYRYKYSVVILYVFWPDVQQQNVQKLSSILDAILSQLLYGVTLEHSDFTVFTSLWMHLWALRVATAKTCW